jgi:hypothetical protein
MQLPNFAGDHETDINDILAFFDDHRDNDERTLGASPRATASLVTISSQPPPAPALAFRET